ncbi:type 2 periplasmic-binding domain-containing protein [Luteibaculum oceani]|uniref:ABC transporter substrate-binding protein n=1 Tax=Luteibaculum oceani TaxID=1294296 RepID=A0A5C6UYN9_9FLAO|nr:ABC transporter substrate-binding protein [Luteibaculum oceani]TXC78532.1 ABC transporter substrate-binding protein [Luteibaculum oceani]
MKLTITGVPEHFNYPIVSALEQNPNFKNISWTYSSGGTGQMLAKLESGEVDAALLLTDGFIKSQESKESAPFFIDFYIGSPLVWGIHTHGDSELPQLPNTVSLPVLISRFNSGSHLMYKLLCHQQNWEEKANYKVIGNLDGALEESKSKEDFLFLWEKFTTQPYVTTGNFKRIGEIPTPWPAFVLAVSPRIAKKEVKETLTDLLLKAKEIAAAPGCLEKFMTFSKLPAELIEPWYRNTRWCGVSNGIEELKKAAAILKEIGTIEDIPNFKVL